MQYQSEHIEDMSALTGRYGLRHHNSRTPKDNIGNNKNLGCAGHCAFNNT